jgi:hypothetical protein
MARGTFAAGLAVAIGLMLSSCTTSSVECDCVDTALFVNVPADIAPDVQTVTPSGPACTGVIPTCSDSLMSGTCTRFRVAPNATGACYVAVVFSSGAAMFMSQSDIVEGAACCGGFAASTPSGADIEVPDESTDGGASSNDP